jgi:hypothetical protein
VDRVVRTARRRAETRPTKPARPGAPTDATLVAQPPDPDSGRVAKDTNGSPVSADHHRRPGKPQFDPAAALPAGPPDSYPDQLPREQPPRTGGGGRNRADSPGEQYVRLRVRLRGDQLTVLDSHLVDGPLGQVTGFP